ncbi:MAG: hypothetical protein ACRDHL_05060, partial [Candidatus Promineifilaceae bacterium]
MFQLVKSAASLLAFIAQVANSGLKAWQLDLFQLNQATSSLCEKLLDRLFSGHAHSPPPQAGIG